MYALIMENRIPIDFLVQISFYSSIYHYIVVIL